MSNKERIISVIGLGYVGLPVAVAFAEAGFNVLGFDIDINRIKELKEGHDKTFEVENKRLNNLNLTYTDKSDDIGKANFHIITVPTPITNANEPDISHLIKASETVGKQLAVGDFVVYESTVYPGCTEEICVPLLEKVSRLKFNQDFFCGYSPERINPGDKNHKLKDIKKITSGSNKKIANLVDNLYKEIIPAGTFKAKNIKVAEAAKIIENTQRDINIALVNELSMLFNKMDIDTEAVLKAAETKWNFISG